jgi:hypothetical protein
MMSVNSFVVVVAAGAGADGASGAS